MSKRDEGKKYKKEPGLIEQTQALTVDLLVNSALLGAS